MRIAVYHNQGSGGARRALHGFCRWLSGRHKVHVYTLSTADQDLLSDDDVATEVTVLEHHPRRPSRGGLYLNDLRRLNDLRDLDRVSREAATLIDRGRHDVVLVDACRFTYAPFVLRYLATPSLFYCHHGPWRLEREWRAPESAYASLRRLVHMPAAASIERWLVAADRDLVRRASAVVSNSEYSRLRIRAEYGVDADVCPPGVDLPPAAPSRDAHGVVSIGALERHKGFDFLVSALATLPRGRRPRLTIVANDANARVRADLVQQARAAGVDLVLRERIFDDELQRVLGSAKVFLYAPHQEPLGLAPLEAMAAGLPVVAVAEGGVRETVVDGETGVLTDRDPRRFGREVGLLLADSDRAHRMGAAGRALVAERWSWAVRGPALEEQLCRLAELSEVGVRCG